MTQSEIIETIKSRRILAGLSQKDLAKKVGITQPNYSAIESGRSEPRLGTLCKIAKALKMRVDIHW